jgi:hypothetical protein
MNKTEKEELNNKLTKCYNYLEKLLEEAKTEKNEFEGWKFHSENSNWKLFTGKGTSTLISGIIHASPKIILEYFEEFEKYAKYDSFFDSGSLIKDFTEEFPDYLQTSLCHFKYKGFWPIFSERDFSCVFSHKQLKDGTFVCPSFSIESNLVPKESGYVRGEIGFPSGYIIEELEEGKCRVTSTVEIIMNGWISSSFMSLIVSETFPIMKKCTELCEKDYKDFKK